MYTEENEFDYNEYLNESNDYSSNNKSFNKGFIIKVLLIVLCLILVIFLVFKIKNNNSSNNNNNDAENSLLVFNNNIAILKDAAETYFFDQENMPKEVGEEVVVTVSNLMDENLVSEIKDYDGYSCGFNTSYVSMIKNKNDYMLKIYLLCPSLEDSVVYYYDFDEKCLNCNGENYVSNNEDLEDSDSNLENDNQEEVVISCQEFGEWTTDYIEDPTLERESRVVVIGYKDNNTYGEWSEATTTPLTGSEILEVKVEEKEELVKKTSDWVTGLSNKPEEKEGRVIEKYTKSSSYTTYETKTEKITKTLTSWDSSADSCKTTGIGKVECTYTKETEVPVKKYSTKTYYKYQDTTEELVKNTYYQSREIIKGEPVYTDYILESEMPDGYQILAGSEITQYRYREACTK